MHAFTTIPSPAGTYTLAAEGNALTGLWLEGQKYFAATLPQDAVQTMLPVFDQTRNWLERYFAGENPQITFPLAPKGSPFRQAVWKLMLQIPYGKHCTYGELAKRLQEQGGKPVCAQAVGGAVGHNPISILIPCHRVVGTNGSLTGYAGGLAVKEMLLSLESRG